MMKHLKSVIVLTVICAVMATLLAAVNYITEPIIKAQSAAAENAALAEVLPGGEGFEVVDLTAYELPATVEMAYKASNGGYVVKLNAKGFKPNLIIMCGINANGEVVGAKCISSEETYGQEKTYGEALIGKTLANIAEVDSTGTATLTKTGYKNAINDALTAVAIFGGAQIEIETPEKLLQKSLSVVLPGGEGFEKFDYSAFEIPASIGEVYKASNGGFVYKATVKGFGEGLVILCGIDASGNVTGAVCLESNETYGQEKTYGESLVGTNLGTIAGVDSTGTATFTKTAYKGAVKDALTANAIIAGLDVEVEKTPEELLAEALSEALPASNGECTLKFVPEVLEGIDKVYSANNGQGYVLLMGEKYIGVDVSGKAVTADATADEIAAAEAAVAKIEASTMTEIDLTAYEGIHKTVVKAYKTASGNYVFELNAVGYNMQDHYAYEKQPIVIMAAATADGKLIAVETVSQNESKGFGAACAEPEFYGQYAGKTEADYKEIDGIAGATITTNAYNSAIGKVFAAIQIMEGAAQ